MPTSVLDVQAGQRILTSIEMTSADGLEIVGHSPPGPQAETMAAGQRRVVKSNVWQDDNNTAIVASGGFIKYNVP
jgi:hypothetical protein